MGGDKDDARKKTSLEMGDVKKDVFPLANLPFPSFKHLLKFLTKQEKNNLRLCSKSFDKTVYLVCSGAGKWNITVTRKNKKELLPALLAAKTRQIKEPRDIMITLNFACCGRYTDESEAEKCSKWKKKVLKDWRYRITDLRTEILGKEEFFHKLIFPQLEALEFRIYLVKDPSANMQIVTSAICNNILSLEKLTIQNPTYDEEMKFFPLIPSLPLSTLVIDKWQMGTVEILVSLTRETLTVLDIHSCFSYTPCVFSYRNAYTVQEKLAQLEHLSIRYSMDVFKLILHQVDSSKLVTLRLVNNDFEDYCYLDQLTTLPKCKFLWLDGKCDRLVDYELDSLEVLVAIKLDYSDYFHSKTDFTKLKFPKLKELTVEGTCTWCIQLIQQNADTLERLTILRPNDGYCKLLALDCVFPNMKLLALRCIGRPLKSLVSSMEDKCPKSTTILTDSIEILEETKRHAKTYPYPMPGIKDDLTHVIGSRIRKDIHGFDSEDEFGGYDGYSQKEDRPAHDSDSD